ncbi:ubiquinol-cytochrome-c reductase complex assembly factor 6 [Lutzomyia longipalpis]|uniref:ubiquinol-cytochrome-c reductase complex assembly factor 6 n=1 Tax=Lutzomyia longipalpis TaxID=7200 RepID=UPI002484578B|nr:ubiquinol-cytochrome-c reductase complex assembly factor 6 [Lutzomyia longipalpis]
MPAGVTWGQYMRFFIAAMLSMAAGAQVVHNYYKPMKDLDAYVAQELQQLQSGSTSSSGKKLDNS